MLLRPNEPISSERTDQFAYSASIYFGLPPTIAEAAAPAAAARSSAGSMSAPDSRWLRKAATNASPAPVVSTASIFGVLTRQRLSPQPLLRRPRRA